MKMPFVALLALILAPVARAGDDERSIAPADLPAAVTQAIASRYAGATVTAASKEGTGKKTEYEATLKIGDRTLDVDFDASGATLEEEEAIAADQLPAAVKAALDKAAPGKTPDRLEKSTAAGAVRYEAAYGAGEDAREVVVDASGKIVRDRKD